MGAGNPPLPQNLQYTYNLMKIARQDGGRRLGQVQKALCRQLPSRDRVISVTDIAFFGR